LIARQLVMAAYFFSVLNVREIGFAPGFVVARGGTDTPKRSLLSGADHIGYVPIDCHQAIAATTRAAVGTANMAR
jgi:hypothetical protein